MADKVSLDRRITIQSATEAQDAAGQPIETWTDFAADLPAQFMPGAGREQFDADQRLATAAARFRVRHRTDLTREMRIVYDSQNWNVRNIAEDMRFERRQYMILTAELITAP